MSMDLKIEMAKDEYVNAINEINNKYDLPLTITALILNNILIEVERVKAINIENEKTKIKEENSK